MPTNEESSQALLKATSKTFGESVLRAALVAADGEDGDPKKLTQHELAKKAGVGRSTIAKYSAGGDDDKSVANPDLLTICRLADALNVPPAFMLMSADDWNHLAQAAAYYADAMKDEKFVTMSREIADSSVANAKSSALLGLNLAKKFKLHDDKPVDADLKARYAEQITRQNKRVRGGILAMSALPPIGQVKKGQIAPLLTMCAIIGAQIKTFD
ncbi:MAG: helix-turn-helix transcriptional regulator [Burkholderiaceae bacterium]|nr:helix-turn-helix transcriptional regulator [Burkholderiaceae bacterium]